MIWKNRHSEQCATQQPGRFSALLFGRCWGWLLILFIIMGGNNSYAQPQVPIPNPAWPLDSVVNGSVHYYTVKGDTNYTAPSRFVWTVSGGRLFKDQALTTLAGDGTVATIAGNSNNVTTLWVIWDQFDTPLDTGYVYVYEISDDGCQRSDNDEGKFQGMRIKVSSPPKARFILPETIACSNFDTARVVVEIEGMPPYDLIYNLNGTEHTWHIYPDELSDLDGDGEADNVAFNYSGFSTMLVDTVYSFQLVRVESGGVVGDILENKSHDLIVHIQPPAPEIFHQWTEATVGTTKTYSLSNRGVNPEEWFWNLRDKQTNLVAFNKSTESSDFEVTLDADPGWYFVEAQYRDNYGCYSPFDSMNIELFNLPTIAFSDSTPDIINCSATSLNPDEEFNFVVEYKGALTYGFTYDVYDYNGYRVGGDSFDKLTNRSNIISIKNNFINDALPEEIRPWKVVITKASNNEEGVNVNILDSGIEGGRDERTILIYPKPFIHDDIDFAN